jgi:hypothetical protein
MPSPDDQIQVCDECLMSSCWQGIHMCQGSRDAGTTYMSRAELERMGREHPSYLKTDEDLANA